MDEQRFIVYFGQRQTRDGKGRVVGVVIVVVVVVDWNQQVAVNLSKKYASHRGKERAAGWLVVDVWKCGCVWINWPCVQICIIFSSSHLLGGRWTWKKIEI